MRELKFKAWHEELKRMSKPFTLKYTLLNFADDFNIASEVKYFEGAFIAGSPLTSNALINFNCANNVSVIGNIYENKDLI